MPDNSLQVGFARTDIPPPVGFPIVGRMRLGGTLKGTMNSTGVRRSLYARAAVFKAAGGRAGVVVADLCFCPPDLVDSVRATVAREGVLQEHELMICVTHTHSGPPASEMFGFDGEEAEQWFEVLYGRIAGAVLEASRNCAPATLSVGKGVVKGIASNRRLRLPDGTVTMNFLVPPSSGTPVGPVDEEVAYLACHNAEGRPLGFLSNFACHPQVFLERESLLFGSDIYGVALDRLEAQLGGIGLLLNGAEGNLNVFGHLRERTHEDEERLGGLLAEGIMRISRKAQTVPEPLVETSSEWLDLPLRQLPSRQEVNAELERRRNRLQRLTDSDADSEDIWKAQRELSHMEELDYAMRRGLPDRARLELQALRLGPALLLGVPGELFVECGLEIKKRSPFADTWVVGPCNGYVGYIPTRESFAQGGYEVNPALTSRVAPESGELVVEALVALADKMKHGP